MGILLNEGIGDTIRISLTPRPGGDRREEVYAACELLQALGLRSFAPSVTACPGCGRTTSTTFQELAERIQDYVREKMPEWKLQYEGVETMTLAVMGCIVNGPGESRAANIGISLPGTGEAPSCPVYIDGQHFTTLRGNYDELSAAFRALVDDYVATKYSPRAAVPAGRSNAYFLRLEFLLAQTVTLCRLTFSLLRAARQLARSACHWAGIAIRREKTPPEPFAHPSSIPARPGATKSSAPCRAGIPAESPGTRLRRSGRARRTRE